MDDIKMTDQKIKQPIPSPDYDVSYVCKYDSEIDRSLVIKSMGHYIQEVIGTLDIVFIKVPMEAINKQFRVDPQYPGEEIEFNIDFRKNNIVKFLDVSGDDLPALWSVLSNAETGLKIITTIEPCKFIMRTEDLPVFEKLMSETEIAPKEYNYESLRMVHWNEQTAVLKRDIEFFATGKKFFDSRDMPYSRSYLLHGDPGNGKTTTIKAIAKFLNTKPETFDFSAAMQTPDKQFLDWVLGDSERIAREESSNDDDDSEESARSPIRLLVLEDIDRLFPKDGSKQTQVTLQAVLQALDGAIERRNMVIVATANNPKEIDQKVLARPGRFDKQVFYAKPSEEEAFLFLKKLFEGEKVSDETLRDACKKLSGHSYAFHKELFATAASYTIENMSTIVTDDDVRKGIKDLMTHTDNINLKATSNKVGFGS